MCALSSPPSIRRAWFVWFAFLIAVAPVAVMPVAATTPASDASATEPCTDAAAELTAFEGQLLEATLTAAVDWLQVQLDGATDGAHRCEISAALQASLDEVVAGGPDGDPVGSQTAGRAAPPLTEELLARAPFSEAGPAKQKARIATANVSGEVASVEAGSVHAVTPGSEGNRIALAFAAPVAGTYRVRVSRAPEWIETGIGDVEVTAEAEAETEALVAFDVTGAAPVGEEGTIVIEIVGPGGRSLQKGVCLTASAPAVLALSAYPNPFAASAQIVYDLPSISEVELAVYDVLGRRVLHLAEGEHAAGRHMARLRGHSLAAGTYVVRLQTKGADGESGVLHRRLTHVR